MGLHTCDKCGNINIRLDEDDSSYIPQLIIALVSIVYVCLLDK